MMPENLVLEKTLSSRVCSNIVIILFIVKSKAYHYLTSYLKKKFPFTLRLTPDTYGLPSCKILKDHNK